MDGLDITTNGEQKKVTKKAERFIEQLWIGSLMWASRSIATIYDRLILCQADKSLEHCIVSL